MIAKLFDEQRPLMVAGLLFMIGGFVLLGLSIVDDIYVICPDMTGFRGCCRGLSLSSFWAN
jgi:hypothetical protein